MESASEVTSPSVGAALPYSVERHDPGVRRPEVVVLQVDSTVSSLDGLRWLTGRRDAQLVRRIDALRDEALADAWSWEELTRARLRLLRPRRAEITALGAAYLGALAPGAVEAARALRRAGVSVALASDLAAEALFGVAAALGVSPDEVVAPRLRFDAIGAYVGCDLATPLAGEAESRTLFVGTQRSAMFAPRGSDAFVAFSGVIAREGRSDAVATISALHDLPALVLR